MANTEPNWVAVDWGTTNLRLWLLDAQGQILRQRSSDMGMSRLSLDGYEPVLLDLVQDLLIDDQRLTVVCCGMVGAKTGWVEAPYSKVPCAPAHLSSIVSVKTVDPRLSVYILAGLSQAQPADVMRGDPKKPLLLFAETSYTVFWLKSLLALNSCISCLICIDN